MVDKKFREALNRFIEDQGIDEDILILDNHAYDDSIVGISADYRLVYSYEKMVKEFMKDEHCDETEAYEWLDYNTMRSLPYMGERAPIIMATSKKSILECYGD